jgi:hypothetical protein
MGQLVVTLMYHLRMVSTDMLREGSAVARRQNTLFTQGINLTRISSFVPSHTIVPTNARIVHNLSHPHLFVARLDIIFVRPYGLYIQFLFSCY